MDIEGVFHVLELDKQKEGQKENERGGKERKKVRTKERARDRVKKKRKRDMRVTGEWAGEKESMYASITFFL